MLQKEKWTRAFITERIWAGWWGHCVWRYLPTWVGYRWTKWTNWPFDRRVKSELFDSNFIMNLMLLYWFLRWSQKIWNDSLSWANTMNNPYLHIVSSKCNNKSIKHLEVDIITFKMYLLSFKCTLKSKPIEWWIISEDFKRVFIINVKGIIVFDEMVTKCSITSEFSETSPMFFIFWY